MEIIELHILQSFPVSCLNRDDVGAPKTAVFGGAPRARVSSQSWKRAIRLHARENSPDHFAGQRGHFVAAILENALLLKDIDPNLAREESSKIVTFLGKQDNKHKEAHKSAVALYLSPGEIEAIADATAQDIKESGEVQITRGYLRKALSKARPRDMADIALFGRMVADDHTLTLEGAALFSHALSTHRVSNEIDFFTAVDDLKPAESEGAGHMGTLEFNTACYYRYAGINLGLLADEAHLGHLSHDDLKEVVKTFLKAVVEAVPGARHNSMFASTMPQFILGLYRDSGQPLSLANAFEKPIWSAGGLVEKSREALENHYDGLKKTYGLNGTPYRVPEITLDALIEGLADHVS